MYHTILGLAKESYIVGSFRNVRNFNDLLRNKDEVFLIRNEIDVPDGFTEECLLILNKNNFNYGIRNIKGDTYWDVHWTELKIKL